MWCMGFIGVASVDGECLRMGLCNPHIQFKKSIFKPAQPPTAAASTVEGER